jgi:hypothetical protein
MKHEITFFRQRQAWPSLPVDVPPRYVFVLEGDETCPDGDALSEHTDMFIEVVEMQGSELREVRLVGRNGAEYVFETGPLAGVWHRFITPAATDECVN